MYLPQNYISKIKMFVPAHLLAEDSSCIVPVYIGLYMMADMNKCDWMRRKTTLLELCKNTTFFNSNDIRKRHVDAVKAALDKLEEFGYIKCYGRADNPKAVFEFDFTKDVSAVSKLYAINGKNLISIIEFYEFKILWEKLVRSDKNGCAALTSLRVYLALKIYAECWKNQHKHMEIPVFVGCYRNIVQLLNISQTTMKECIKELRELGLILTTYCKHTNSNDKRKGITTIIIVFTALCVGIDAEKLTEQVELVLENEGYSVTWYKPGWTLSIAKAVSENQDRNIDNVLDIVPDDPITYGAEDIF